MITCTAPLTAPALPAFPDRDWQLAEPASQGFDQALLNQAVEQFGTICGSDGSHEMVIVRNGYVVWKGDRTDNLHPIHSCTKSFLSVCFGLLWDDGRCSPDTLAAGILPQLAEHYPALTLGQLTSMTGGFASTEPFRWLEPAAPLFAPGTAFCYDEQPNLLAIILTRLAGEPLRDLFMRRIGTPIGIRNDEIIWGTLDLTGEKIPVNGGIGRPPSGVSMTAQALARFGWLFCQRGAWAGQQLISTNYIDAATTVRVPASLPPHDVAEWYRVLPGHYGFGWWVNGTGNKLMWPGLPAGAYAAQGNRNNICIVIPSWNTVIVRMGSDPAVDAGKYDAAFAVLREALRAGGGIGPGEQASNFNPL
jgi:CubicO group peptidase (beta-lactamase class C family)